MKQGSTDDPFAEDPSDQSAEEITESSQDTEDSLTQRQETQREAETDTDPTLSSEPVSGSGGGSQTLPYIYARNSVKDGRQQRPIFLRDEVEDSIPELVSKLESTFGENVYRTDVLEAAVVVAQENPELVEAALEEWGYGWE